MNKICFFLSAIIAANCLIGCKKDIEQKTETPGVVINELMPLNSSVVADQNGEFDDWIELYNLNDSTLDLSGYFLTDSKTNLTKWKLPTGTLISGKSYLIVWADSDTLQSGLHANYKLSSAGETVVFLDPELKEIDRVSYGPVPGLIQQSYARIPNGTGVFSWQLSPTYNSENIQNQ
jgi:hypothetical protein